MLASTFDSDEQSSYDKVYARTYTAKINIKPGSHNRDSNGTWWLFEVVTNYHRELARNVASCRQVAFESQMWTGLYRKYILAKINITENIF